MSLMDNKLKKIASLLLLMVFFLPSIVQLTHHHEHFECKAKNEKHYHKLHEKCAVCDFQFSVFSNDFFEVVVPKQQHSIQYCNNYSSVNYSTLSKYSFQLRAPPVKQV